MDVTRSAPVPCFDIALIQLSSSSVESEYILQASSASIRPHSTAVTTAALRLATHLEVFFGGKSDRLIFRPSGVVANTGPFSRLINIRKTPFAPLPNGIVALLHLIRSERTS